MKNSGIEWFGALPEQWEISTIGALYTVRNEKVSDTEYPPLSVTMKGVVPQLETAAKTDAHDDRKLIKKGDFAINSRSDRRGSCGISEYDGSVSLINTILTPRAEMNPHYYNWLFHTAEFADEFYKWGHGIVDDLWTTRWQEMKNISLPIPSLAEQEKISGLLAEKVSKIDALILNQERQIEKLKQYKQSLITEVVTKGLDPTVPLKDSGIEWIGKIPQGWNLNRIKYISEFNPPCSRKISDETIVSYAPMDCIKNGYMIPQEIEYSNVSSGLTYFCENDIVMAKVTPCFENGNIAIAPTLQNGVAFGSSELFVFRAIEKKIEKKWLFYYLQSTRFVEKAKSTMTGTGGLKRVSPAFVKDHTLALPPKEDQIVAVDFLDKKVSQIDCLISVKQSKIEKLNQYKKSLIYEYVTGKKEVNQ